MNTDNLDHSITLKSVLSNPEIAVISDECTSWDELFNQFMRYLKLSRRGRRLSDYYSVELFGCTVPDKFLTMHYRFKPDSPVPVNGTVLISEPDLYYNKKAFDDGLVNLCFVIGYSGSGKSYLTREYSGDNLEKVELDNIVCVKDHYTMDELKSSGDLLYSFFSGPGAKYYVSRAERDVFADHSEMFVSFINYARTYAADHTDKRFILEGIWTYLFFDDPSEFDKYAVFMKGTSLAKSKMRRIVREATDKADAFVDRLLEFGIYAPDTALHDGNVDKWRRYFEKKAETVIKPEDNNLTHLYGNITSEVHNVNRCFVQGDRDGIRKIMENAIASKDMDLTLKAVLVEECKKALADL